MLHNAVILMCALAAGAVPAGRHPSHPPFTAGTTFRVDIGAARRALHALAPDDRPNQVADWAVIGALYRSGLPQDDIRKALYDKVPLRDPALEEVASFDYGPGRHVNLQNETWLFRPEADPHPAATLGRLADQARLELGSIPRQLAVFTYRSDLPRGQIQVTLQARVPGPSLFRPAAGYVEQDVSTIGELSDWLESVDDVTYVSLLGGGQVRFGGRRFEDHRTPGATLDDLAALAHAQQAIQDDRRSRPDPARVITLFNQGLDHARSGALGKAADALDAADQELSRIDGGGREGAVRAEGGSRASPEVLRPRFDALRARIDHVREHWEEYAARLAARSKPLPPEPGFSLDPAWDARPLSRDLANLALHPRDLVRQAVEIARTVEGNPADHDALPIESHAAVKVAAAAWAQTRNLGNARDWQPQLSAAQAAVVRQSTDLWKSGDVEKAGMVIFANVRSWRAGGAVPEPSPTVSEDLFGALTEFVMARSQVQCARYDGPLKGTHVGMVLFYTDLMAKVWASVDYHHSAPVDDVDGFRSEPRISSAVEPIYWPEIERLSSTRLWFGPRRDAVARSRDDRELYFGHIGTRLYAAGADPLHPDAESRPAESSRRVVTWWDRHYAEVADFEPQYHVQNQIMKWSVITGMLAERDRLGELGRQRVDRSNRFDRWFAGTAGLRFRADARLLPEGRWISGTECMEILESRRFKGNGSSWSISGGVSLGSARTLKSRAIQTEVEAGLRRGTLDSSAGGDVLRSIRGAEYTLSKPAPGTPVEVQVQIPKEAVLRSGGLDLSGQQSMALSFSAPKNAPPSIQLALGKAPVGELEVALPRDGSVTLAWKDGVQMAERDLAQQLANAPSRASGSVEVKVPPSFQQVFLQRTEKGLQAFARAPDGTIISFSGAEPGAGTTLTTVGVQTGNKISVAPVSEEAVHQALGSSRWLQVEPRGTGPGQSLSAVFTNEGPPPSARPFSLAGEGGEPLRGLTDGKRVYLERPAGPASAQVAFDNAVAGRQLTPELVSEALGGNPARDLVAGRESAAARAFLGARSVDPHAQLAKVLDRLEQRDLAGAAKAGNEMYPLGQGKWVEVAPGLRSSGFDAEAVAVKAQAATLSRDTLYASALRDVSLVKDGDALVSQAVLDRPLVSRTLTQAEAGEVAAQVASGKATAYVPEGGVLSRKNWDFAPRESFSEAAKDANVVWEEFDASELGGLAPEKLMQRGGETFVRRSGPWGTASADSGGGSGGPVYLLRYASLGSQSSQAPSSGRGGRTQCDQDGDGKVSDEELRRCCDRDGDGKVSTEERRRCG